jgi:hypothetical protein
MDEQPRRKHGFLKTTLMIVGVIALWILLARFVLPWLGVST